MVILLTSEVSAQGMDLDLPPGIAAQAQPLLEAMMNRMQQNSANCFSIGLQSVHRDAARSAIPRGLWT